MFIELASTDLEQYLSWIIFAIFSICVHESAHARMAVHFGDNTPRYYIRINPKRQMGWFSLGLLMIIGIAWGAVPVAPNGCGSRRRNALVSLAGPLANLALCALFALLAQTMRLWDADHIADILYYGSYVNGALFLFNLCPVPPLDGFGVLRSLAAKSPAEASSLNAYAGIGLMVLWMTPLGALLFTSGGRLANLFSQMWLAPFRLFS
jgi:Zn-dependent protease